jgi:hypothetical protein
LIHVEVGVASDAVYEEACPARHFRRFERAIGVKVHPPQHFGRVEAASPAESAAIETTPAPPSEPSFLEARSIEPPSAETPAAESAFFKPAAIESSPSEASFFEAAEPAAAPPEVAIIVVVPIAAALGKRHGRDQNEHHRQQADGSK